jgi:hypothetical protein
VNCNLSNIIKVKIQPDKTFAAAAATGIANLKKINFNLIKAGVGLGQG